MHFDPEKVSRHTVRNCDVGFAGRGQTTQMVTANDYDQLLEVYKDTLKRLNQWRSTGV